MLLDALSRRASAHAPLHAGALVACVGGCAAVFLALAQLTTTHGVDGVDGAVLEWATAHRTPLLSALAAVVTMLGSRLVIAVAAALIGIALWRAGRRLAALDVALACGAAAALTHAAKLLLARPRPPLTAQVLSASGFSFPSGHASAIAALLTVTAFYSLEAVTSRRRRAALVSASVLLGLGVGASRVYLGAHYPSDVIAGLAVGIACALAAHAIAQSPLAARGARAPGTQAPQWRAGASLADPRPADALRVCESIPGPSRAKSAEQRKEPPAGIPEEVFRGVATRRCDGDLKPGDGSGIDSQTLRAPAAPPGSAPPSPARTRPGSSPAGRP